MVFKNVILSTEKLLPSSDRNGRQEALASIHPTDADQQVLPRQRKDGVGELRCLGRVGGVAAVHTGSDEVKGEGKLRRWRERTTGKFYVSFRAQSLVWFCCS